MTRPEPKSCPRCKRPVLEAVDYTTDQKVYLDPRPTPGGRVEVKSPPLTRLALVAIDHITVPAPRQPAYELHDRTCPFPPEHVAVDLSDDPGIEQSRGWRR